MMRTRSGSGSATLWHNPYLHPLLIPAPMIDSCSLPGLPDGWLLHGVHHAPRLLSGAGPRCDGQDRHHLPGALQGAHQGPLPILQDLLHLEPGVAVPGSVADPGSGAFLTPGYGMGKKFSSVQFNSTDFYWVFLASNIRVNWLLNHSFTLVSFLWPFSCLRVGQSVDTFATPLLRRSRQADHLLNPPPPSPRVFLPQPPFLTSFMYSLVTAQYVRT
jgi:hypothetical protein